jgi:hypothetical protein
MDMITDVTMINEYMNTPGQAGYGKALIAMVGLCNLCMLAMAWCQTRKGPKKEMAKEVLIVLSSLKPGIDAYRVANGQEQAAYAVLPPHTELGQLQEGGERIETTIPVPHD